MSSVALFTRAWIEIQSLCTHNTRRCVALFTRAWIEISFQQQKFTGCIVALFTRAWIEIYGLILIISFRPVALFTRAWIEIIAVSPAVAKRWSPSSRGRGLKYCRSAVSQYIAVVALFTRAWIEMDGLLYTLRVLVGRPLHEGVD